MTGVTWSVDCLAVQDEGANDANQALVQQSNNAGGAINMESFNQVNGDMHKNKSRAINCAATQDMVSISMKKTFEENQKAKENEAKNNKPEEPGFFGHFLNYICKLF